MSTEIKTPRTDAANIILQKVHGICDALEIDDAETANERVQFLADKLSAWKSTCDQITDKEGHEASPLILTTYVNELKQQLATCQQDSERLDWMIEYSAWISWSMDHEVCNVWHRDEDEESLPYQGYPQQCYYDPRKAIDAAIAGEGGKL